MTKCETCNFIGDTWYEFYRCKNKLYCHSCMEKAIKLMEEIPQKTECGMFRPSPRVYVDTNTGKKMVKMPDGKTLEYP